MSWEKKAGLGFSVAGAALLLIKLFREPKIEWDWSDTGEAVGYFALILAGGIAYLVGPKK